MKLIFVLGGSISGLGKGVTTSSLGKILQSTGKSIGIMKIDPYLQIDAGTMSPYEHGEVFVTDDGGECDLDIGNYERFTNQNLTRNNNITTGKIYLNVINKERKGEYLGKTVQIVPHITNEIKDQIINIAKNYEITIVEIGGTVGDIESAPFLEAIRQIKKDIGKINVMYTIVTPLLYLSYSGEIKTKLVQSSVSELRKCGIVPDMIFCRTEIEIDQSIKNKLAQTCDVDEEAIIEAKNLDSIYLVPEYYEKQGITDLIAKRLGLGDIKSDLKNWSKLTNKITNYGTEVNIGIVGKYTEFKDTYKSISEAFIHAGIDQNCKVNLKWINSEKISTMKDLESEISDISGILIPGGFGERGVEGKILATQFARINNIPFLGICLGLQIAVIEFARNVCGLEGANSTEFNEKTKYPVIDLMEHQKEISDKGGTMRLGGCKAFLKENSLAMRLYGKREITERHRHRYEVNPKYHEILEKKGLIISGTNIDKSLVEFIELANHPYFIATQAHPEFLSRLEYPHPLFVGLVKNALANK